MPLDQSVGGVASLEAILLFLTTSTLILRFIARSRQQTSLGVDDWLVVPAWLCFVGIASIGIYGMVHRFVGFPELPNQAALGPLPTTKAFYALDMLSVGSLGFTRLSALFFYRRVFIVSTKWDSFGILNFALIIIVILWTLGYILLQVFGCGDRFWELFASTAVRDCAIQPMLESVAISSFILDVLVLTLPIHKIWRLHTTIVRKLVITAVFLLATAGVAASCARMVINTESILAQIAHVKSTDDIFLFDTKLLYYLTLEAGLAQIAVNLPTLWYLRKGIKAESILRSIRSIISLGSIHSSPDTAGRTKQLDGSASDLGGGSEIAVENSKQPTRRDRFETGTSSIASSN